MCGIFGYIGSHDAVQIIRDGLSRLEYRGYDSAGIEVAHSIRKCVGPVCNLDTTGLAGFAGVGHTRWATTGAVTVDNAHPHSDCSGEISVVHNGIIENWREVRSCLPDHNFKSDTDSEVIAHLLERCSISDIPRTLASHLVGSFAVIIHYGGVLIGIRHESPLVVGHTSHGTILSSDVYPLIGVADKVAYLENDDAVFAFEDGFKIYDSHGNPVHRPLCDLPSSQVGALNSDHYMLQEISEQGDTIQRAISQSPGTIERISDMVATAHGIMFVACGSSYHACLTGAYMFSKIAGKHVNVIVGSEFEHYRHFLEPGTLVVAVSQSGETADVLNAVRIAKSANSNVVCITNVVESSLYRASDELLIMNSGPEICVLSTKTYTSQVVLLALLAAACVGDTTSIKRDVQSLCVDVFNMTSQSMRNYVMQLAMILSDVEHLYTIGSGPLYPTAMEAALKIKEVSYIHAEAFSAGELKHGPIALIEPGTPVIAFGSVPNAVDEIKSRGGYIIGVAAKHNPAFDFWIKVPDSGYFDPIVQIIPMQLLAYDLALIRDCDPDRPRNLAKCVTVR